MENRSFFALLALIALTMHGFSYFEIIRLHGKLEAIKNEYSAFRVGCLNGR